MKKTFLALIGVAAVILAVIVLLKLAPTTSVGQAPTANAGATRAGGTAWGEPDLQGLWTYDYEIPLQRPARYANKEFFTDEERAELDRVRTGALTADNRPHARGSERDVS